MRHHITKPRESIVSTLHRSIVGTIFTPSTTTGAKEAVMPATLTESQVLAYIPNAQQSRQGARVSIGPLDAISERLLRQLDRASRRKPAAMVAGFVQAVWLRYLAWQLRRSTRMLLDSLDDRMLHDIGLHRSEIDTVVHQIAWQKLRG